MYVCDTHAFLWYLTEDRRLGRSARNIFEKADMGETIIIIPTIVLAEAFFVVNRLRRKVEFEVVLQKAKEGVNYLTASLDMKVVEGIQNLDKLKDMHDKIIVSTALILNAEIITQDEEIKKSGYVDVTW